MTQEQSGEEEEEEVVVVDELETYLALPQIKYTTERDATDWWKEHAKKFPNVTVMARQYLGCPASGSGSQKVREASPGILSYFGVNEGVREWEPPKTHRI